MINENEPLPQYYHELLQRLKQEWIDAGESEESFMEMLRDSLDALIESRSMRRKKYAAFFSFLTIALLTIYCTDLYSCIACYLQDYIYPGLRLLRKVCIPVLSLFPTLTSLYHRTCLIENPFFAVVDMDCWPCSTVNNIMEVHTIPKPVREEHITPLVYKTEQKMIDSVMLKHFYVSNKDKFDNEAPLILIDSRRYTTPTDMFSQLESGEKHVYVWEFNNNNVAKMLRQIVPRPQIVPRFGQSTERFVIVDTSQKKLQIPDTECNFSFLLSLSGSRTIELMPAEECKHKCKSLKFELKQTYLLWYNWWYWRPTIQSSTGNATFIAHLGSYC